MAVVAGIARAAFKAALPSFIRRGFSANRAIRDSLRMGISFRRKDMLTMFRTEVGYARKRDVVKYTRKDYLPSEEVMSLVDKAMPRAYLFKVRLDVYDEDGNFLRHKYSSVLSDERMTPGSAQVYSQETLAPMSEPLIAETYGNATLIGIMRGPS